MKLTEKRSNIINQHLSAADKKQIALLLEVSYSYVWQILKGKRSIHTKKATHLFHALIEKAKQNRNLKREIKNHINNDMAQTINEAVKIIFKTKEGEKITIKAEQYPDIILASVQSICNNKNI